MEQLPKIVRQRLRATAMAGVHPDPDLLAAFAEKSLKERESAQVLQHLAQCAECRNVVSLAMPEIVAPSTIPARSRWLTWPVLRWGALAACALVVSAAVTLRYERQQPAELVVAEKASTSVPSSTVTLESRATDQPAQKLAEKMPPPLPSRADRTFDSVGMLAKQQEASRSGSAAGAPAVGGLQTGNAESRPLEKNAPETGPGGRELADNQPPKTDGLKSLDRDKPSAPPMGRFAAPAASTPPALEPKTASTEEQAKERNEKFDYAAKAGDQAVTVEADAPVIQTTQATVRGAKDESDKKKAETAAVAGLGGSTSTLHDMKHQDVGNKLAIRWTLSPGGSLQRSSDSGKTWQTVPVADNITFRALAANDSDIWIGGAAGALYHSSDAGQHWIQVRPAAGGKLLTSDIVRVEFADSKNGKVITNDHESWTTSDGGVNWQRF